MLVKSYSDLVVWQKAHGLVLRVYESTDQFPKHELYGLTSQIRRCAVSVPSNIAEGFKRNGKLESKRFYNIAEGSLEELKYQLLLARDLKYLSINEYSKMSNQADEVGKLLNGWIKAQKD